MGQRGRELIEKQYTWDKAAGKFAIVCDAVIRGESVPLHPEPMESGSV